jgi:lipopolysaccharide transport system ATP-binding protein
MSSPVIQVENLSKLYRLGEVSTGTLTHDLNRWWHRVRGKEDPYLKIGQVNDRTKTKTKAEKLKSESVSASQPFSVSAFESDYVYALKDINFSVNQGEVLGIIGRNGAGKSTLLKILSRVTAPTSGRIKVKGRIASLLEVGTGFHPELTGRENIYLNGAILGMRKHEISRRLDEIVDFSGCAAYLDTPVKRYSSGMYVRLAFSVAAHLEPEILIVDEVLAVGDAEFQKKCLNKLNAVAHEGRAILFVSHHMEAIRRLSSRVVWMKHGMLTEVSENVDDIARRYLNDVPGDNASGMEWKAMTPPTDPTFHLKRLALIDGQGAVRSSPVSNTDSVTVVIEGVTEDPRALAYVGVNITNEDGTVVFHSFHSDAAVDDWPQIPRGSFCLGMQIPARFLNEGSYRIEACCGTPNQWLQKPGTGGPAVMLQIKGGLSDSPYWMWKRPGVLAPILQWKLLS